MGIKQLCLSWLGAVLLVVAASAASAQSVPLVNVQRSAMGSGFELTGVIQPLRQATAAAQVGGNVVELLVKAGDRVKAGQPIARIDARESTAQLQRSDAALAQTEAEAAQTRTNAQRAQDLRAQGFVSQAAVDAAQTQLQAAQAAVRQAQAARAQATLARGFATVVAPFDAVVLATHVEAGDLASPGRSIATLYAPGALRAVVQVGVSRTAAARAAQRVTVTLPSGKAVAPMRRVELSTADAVSQTVEWRLDLPPDAQVDLAPGQVVRVRFDALPAAGAEAAVDSAPRLPAAAVLRRGELTAVYLAQGERFVLRAVRLGADHGADGIEVLAGVQPGDRVAADAVKAGLADARPAR
jgi:RND family efflux transporter MFP subunit